MRIKFKKKKLNIASYFSYKTKKFTLFYLLYFKLCIIPIYKIMRKYIIMQMLEYIFILHNTLFDFHLMKYKIYIL